MKTTDFVRVAAGTPTIRVADCRHNAEQILLLMKRAAAENIRLLVLPELCLTAYTCGDLFLQGTLLTSAKDSLSWLAEKSTELELVTVIGLPLVHQDKLYNVATVLSKGKVLGFVPKTHIPNYSEFYELRHFTPAPKEAGTVLFDGEEVPFGTDLIFQWSEEERFRLAVEICEDLWTPSPPSGRHAQAGATVIANLSASDETVGKASYRRSLVSGQSARLISGYVYADAGYGESSTDLVFSGHNLICENGAILDESLPFGPGWAVSELDLHLLTHDRRRLNTFHIESNHRVIPFSLSAKPITLTRFIDPAPFVPANDQERGLRCESILAMQSSGLAKRLEHIGAAKMLVGISGGLDSCLALLVMDRAAKRLSLPSDSIVAVTMPSFGTTSRTKGNAGKLSEALNVDFREISITESVQQHFREIGHSEDQHDVVFENAQARMRTMVLMDMANQLNGIVVGTGDLSELALGWATYNGDHMSMYAVNAGVPKTLIRHIVEYVASISPPELASILSDILATPVSPELLPPTGDEISQQTEELVGPYDLHDFFLYHVMRWGRSPSQVYCLAVNAFTDRFDPTVIRTWLRVFYRRFFSQQFKRSCLPDGPKIGSVTLSPRGDWRMPSDAINTAWLTELEMLD